MKDKFLTVVLMSVMTILPLTTEAHRSETETGPFLARVSPVMFVENTGQWDENARFQVWGGLNGTIWLAEDAIWLSVLEPGQQETDRLGTIPEGQVDKVADSRIGLPPGDRKAAASGRGVNIKLSFIDANPHPTIETSDRLDTTVSYFYGNDLDKWRPDVPVWGGVRYVDLYPGIDLELTSEDGRLAPRLAARVDADLSAVRLQVEGADAVEMEDGFLRLTTSAGVIRWPLLSIPGSYVKTKIRPRGGQGFEIDAPFAVAASPARATMVTFDDPDDMLYGTFLGGSYGELGAAIAVDEAGSAFVAGDTNSIDFPTTPGAFDTTGGYTDGFVAKLDPTGSALVYATYLGGGGSDRGKAIAVDQAGSAYVIGSTGSSDFPVTPGAFDVTHGGGVCGPPYLPVTYHDAFVTRLDPTGSALVYSTFLGSQGYDFGTDIDVDHEGSAYVIIGSDPDLRHVTPDTYDTCPGDSFIAKLNPEGSALTYCTSVVGGSPMAIVADRSGSAYVTGVTGGSDIPVTPGAFDTSYNGGDDAFVARLHPSGNALVYATYLGGSGNDGGYSIAVDPAGGAYIAGHTVSGDFPVTSTAFDTSYNGNYDGDLFVAGLTPAGSALDYATYLGGSDGEFGGSIAVDGSGRAFVSGLTYSSDFPTTPNAFDTSFNVSIRHLCDVFMTGFNQTGSALIYGTFVGGNELDYSFDHGIALDARGDVYVTGETYSDDFPTTAGAFDTDRDSKDAFIVKLAWANRRYLPMMLVD